MTILDAMQDPALFGPWFKGATWGKWRTFLAVLFGLPLPTSADADSYFKHTGRTIYTPGTPAREAWGIVGRRGGKSRIAALVAVFVACFRDYRAHLAPGEVATIAVIAADRRQARTVMRYVCGFIDAVPMLAALVTNRSRESIELNRVVIEVHTASFRSTRGYTLACVIADEVAFWPTDDAGANPDVEILNGLRPGLATLPGALLLAISSPYARRGALWEAYRKHYGQDGDPVLVWQSKTAAMNPNVDAQVIADAYEADEASAAAEYGAEFRRDVETYVSREVVDAVVCPGRSELPPMAQAHYRAFVDPSGGSVDSMTLAIGHEHNGVGILDLVDEVKPPFSPAEVVARFAATLKRYRVAKVTGDRYGGVWPSERFRENGITYELSDRPKSDLYRDALPRLTSGTVELLDHPRLIAQLCALERRTARSGKDSIDHPPRAHDDVVNVVCGVLAQRAPQNQSWSTPLIM